MESYKTQQLNHFFSYAWVLVTQPVEVSTMASWSWTQMFPALRLEHLSGSPAILADRHESDGGSAQPQLLTPVSASSVRQLQHERWEAARKSCAFGDAIWREEARQKEWIFHGGKHAPVLLLQNILVILIHLERPEDYKIEEKKPESEAEEQWRLAWLCCVQGQPCCSLWLSLMVHIQYTHTHIYKSIYIYIYIYVWLTCVFCVAFESFL